MKGERRSRAKVYDLEIYTDGSCKKYGANMNFGGWSFVALRGGEVVYSASGSEYDTTNQRMELTAVIEALKYAQTARQPYERVVIFSDSAYIINCYTQDWYINWQKNGWVNANKKMVANQDLWCQIIPYFDNFWYGFEKVLGHSSIFWNEECDRLAKKAADDMKIKWRGINNVR